MAKNEEIRPFDCATCLNVNTPLCEYCSQITSPSGKKSKPSHYTSAVGGTRESAELAALASKITLRLTTGNPVQLSWVMRYNALITSEKQ